MRAPFRLRRASLATLLPALGLTALFGLAACAGPGPAAEGETMHAAHEEPGHEHGHEADGAGTALELPNRDEHGPADVDRYIERLRSHERVVELRVPEVVAALELAPDAVVADVGCGPGVFALPFARAVPEGLVYAVDVEPRQLDAVRALLLAQHVDNVIPVLASYTNPHLPPHGCDVIFVGDTYHHFEDRIAYLGELADDLAPGGRLVFLEYKPGDLPVGPPADHKLAPGEMQAELEAAGFRLAKSFDLHRYHDFTVWRRAE